MKKLITITLILLLLLVACNSEWDEYNYSNPEQKFKAQQAIKVSDDDEFEEFYECKVWATKRSSSWGDYFIEPKQEYFEGYIAIPDSHDIYIFLYDLKGDYLNGDYTECKVVDFNDIPLDEFKEIDGYIGHYNIDRLKIKKK